MEQENNKTFVDRIWDFFASVKLAIVIFAGISLTSIVGTILEQRAEPERNLQILTNLFGESLAPTLFRIFDKLGFMDMYHSWWFIGLLILFATNLVICSLDRLPRIWRLSNEPISPLPEEKIRKFLITREIVLKGKPEEAKDILLKSKQAGFKFSEVTEEKGLQLFSQKGKYSRLGVYITHLSILVILLGAVIGIRFGFKGFMEIQEGTVSNVVFSGTGKQTPLDFYIRCDTFNVEFYGLSDMPREYRSWLTVIKDGKEVIRKPVTVNDPLTYEGITFYQSSYGLVPGAFGNGILIFNVSSGDGIATTLNLRLGDSFQIPGTNITGKIIDVSPALKIDEHGHAVTYANQMNNPGVFVEFSEPGKEMFMGWILKRHPETWRLPEGQRVEFVDYWGVEYTGLQVRRDPGVWVVYLGCLAMSIGLFIAFFMSHRKIWIKMIEEKNNTKIVIGATVNKNRAAFERKIDRLISVLKKDQAGGK